MGITSKGRASYRPIDDRTRYWGIFFLDAVWEVELRKCSEEHTHKKKNHAHSFDRPVQLPLVHPDTAAELCLNHSFIIQLFLAFPVS